MTFYLINFGVFIIYSNWLKKIKHTQKLILILTFIQFASIMIFRGSSVGTDTMNYSNMFRSIATIPSIANNFYLKFPGYVVLVKGIYKIIPHTYGYMIMSGTIVCLGIWYFIYKNSNDINISILVYILCYFYFSAFNGSRQYMAMVFVLIAYTLLNEEKNWKSLLFFVIAVSIHSTAIVCIGYYLVKRIKWDIKKYCIFIFTIVGGGLSYQILIKWFIVIFPEYSAYLIDGQLRSNIGAGRYIIVFLFYAIVVLISILYNVKSRKTLAFDEKEEKEIWEICALISVSVVIGLMYSEVALFNRITPYFSIFLIILVPKVYRILGRYKIIYLLGFYSISFPLMCYQLYRGLSGVTPYITFLKN